MIKKIYILEILREGPWGGGNQFLKALRAQWQKVGIGAGQPEQADYVLFNSYQNLKATLELKKKYPQKIFIHRLGPIFHYHRGEKWKKIDRLVIKFANHIADLAIFQSRWSYEEAKKLGFKNRYAVIGNAVDSQIFNPKIETTPTNGKIKLITTSWSSNTNKGFAFLAHLDQYLDWSRYSMTFMGNAPVKFKNIRMLSPLDSHDLAAELKKHDIYIAPFKDEAASNAILEALACGLPVVALDSGGNAEEVKSGGELFCSPEELLAKIEKVAHNYGKYRQAVSYSTIETIAQQYLEAIRNLGPLKPHPPFWFSFYLSWKLKTIR